MTLTVQMFTSEDQGAPQWTGTFQGMVDILTACLVDGYGNKQAAGWTKPLFDSTRAAFKNSEADGGSGCFVYVEQQDASSIRAGVCSDMPDLDTKTYGTSDVFAPYSTAYDGWAVWADGRTFYFWAHIDRGSTALSWRSHSLLFAGDYEPRFANSYPYFIIGRDETSINGIDFLSFLALGSSNFPRNTFLSVDPDGITGSRQVTLRNLGQATSAGNASPSAAPLSKTDGDYIFAPAEIAAVAAMGVSPGKLRGAYTCGSDLSAFYDLADAGNLVQREVQTGFWMLPAYITGSNTAESSRGTILLDAQGPW